MLNISHNSINNAIRLKDFESSKIIKKSRIKKTSLWLIIGFLIFLFLCLFLPWTQNISAKGYVTTRSPEQRPQGIQSIIAGRLENWFVQEGDYVQKGDTIVFISEIKSEYFDPNLLARTSEQIDAKSKSVDSYGQKVTALQNQYLALQETFNLKKKQTRNKIEQAKNKISMDSINWLAQTNNLDISKNQLARTQELYDKGLKTLTDLQDKKYKVQSASAKVEILEKKWLNQKNILSNLHLELLALQEEYANKLAKAQSDQQSAIAAQLESVAATSKLQNEFSNYNERQKLYFITAPQSGYIIKTIKKGLGETIKEGSNIATIMPEVYDVAVEMYAKPQDLPLLNIGDRVQIRFDGWPAIYISGWPKSATGVFPGNIVAIDKFISENGLYRILASPDKEHKDWPSKLSVGTGANAFILLNEVPIWYELWRQLNGFPADYYNSNRGVKKEIKRKAPLKSVK